MSQIIQPVIDFINFFYPRSCVACQRVLSQNESFICIECISELPKTNLHHIKNNDIEKIFWGRVPLHHATSFLYFTKKGKAQNMLHCIKYKGYQLLGYELGLWFGQDLLDSAYYHNIDFVVPVPLHPKKLKKRGYNQSEAIAKGIAEGLQTQMNAENLIRSIHSPSQTRKSRYHRWENVSNIFKLKSPETFEGKNILLVDDVITTGATIEACASALSKSKNIRLSIASIAFASL